MPLRHRSAVFTPTTLPVSSSRKSPGERASTAARSALPSVGGCGICAVAMMAFEQRHSRELILYDAAARYLKELKDSGEAITPKAWQREIDQLAAGKQTDTLAMKSMREDLKSVERLRKTAEQLSRQERDKSHDRGPDR